MEKLGKAVEEVGKRGEGIRIGARRRKGGNVGEDALFIGRKLGLAQGHQPSTMALASAKLDHRKLTP